MKQQRKMKDFESIVLNATQKGWHVNTDQFAVGSDWISIRDMYGQVASNEGIPKQISFNTTNGHFFVYEPLCDSPIATHASENLIHEIWYREILDMFYKPTILK